MISYKTQHRLACRWIKAQDRLGWICPQVHRAAIRVRCGLWACANNPPENIAVLRVGLDEDTIELKRALEALR